VLIQAFKTMGSHFVHEDGSKMSEQSPLGERRIIDLIVRRLHKMPRMPMPFGDDVSGMDIGGGRLAILKCDMLVGRTDIPKGMSLRQAARKAVVMNVSDLASKGVQPRAVMVSLGLPRSTMIQDVEEIAGGLDDGAREYGAYVIGGDTGECDDLVIACYLFGIAKRDMMVRRSGARPGDLVAVTGEFGSTLAGLQTLKTKRDIPLSLRKALLASVYQPKARLKEGIALALARALTASMDSSDGLAWSLHEIARASSVGIELDNVPISNGALDYARAAQVDPVDLALYGGEEFELVVCVKKNAVKRALSMVKSLRVIGRVTSDAGTVTLLRDGKQTPVEPRGWEHLTSNTLSP
jgi:thiamine-monophosphate kinase